MRFLGSEHILFAIEVKRGSSVCLSTSEPKLPFSNESSTFDGKLKSKSRGLWYKRARYRRIRERRGSGNPKAVEEEPVGKEKTRNG